MEDIVRPPVYSESVIIVRDDFGLWSEWLKFKIFFKELIKMLEAGQTKLAKAKLHNLVFV